jgi:hypothetical protein
MERERKRYVAGTYQTAALGVAGQCGAKWGRSSGRLLQWTKNQSHEMRRCARSDGDKDLWLF